MSSRIQCDGCRDHLIEWMKVFPPPTYNPAFGMSDIDGFTERNQRFLFVEWKHVGAPEFDETNSGQELALWKLAQEPNAEVLIIWGEYATNTPVFVRRLGIDDKREPVYDSPPLHVRYFIEWYRWADTKQEGRPWATE